MNFRLRYDDFFLDRIFITFRSNQIFVLFQFWLLHGQGRNGWVCVEISQQSRICFSILLCSGNLQELICLKCDNCCQNMVTFSHFFHNNSLHMSCTKTLFVTIEQKFNTHPPLPPIPPKNLRFELRDHDLRDICNI